MGCDVYANNMSIACKAADGKTIAAFPDVCFTPPVTPPTPPGVPIPYPNTAMASDTSDGSKTVMISGQEVMLKDKSVFKTSTGDEAGSAPKKGVVTSQIKGKASFVAWSMDVKFEGENVPRHLDVTLHNENSLPANTPTWPYIDKMTVSLAEKCAGDVAKEHNACKDFTPNKADGPSPCPPDGKPSKQTVESYADRTAANNCLAARRCQLVPYEPSGKQAQCCPGQTGHHLVEASSFFDKGRGGSKSKSVMETEDYNTGKAPCICAEGINQYQGTHGLLHTFQSTAAMSKETIGELTFTDGTVLKTKLTTYGDARDQGVAAAKKTFPESGCDEECIKAQLDAYHNQCGIDDDTQCKQVVTGYKGAEPLAEAEQSVRDRSARIAAERAGAATGGPTW
jgi:hypothetical protein